MHSVHIGFSFSFVVFVSSLPKRRRLASHWILGRLFNLAVHWLLFFINSATPLATDPPSPFGPSVSLPLLEMAEDNPPPAETPPRTACLLAIVPYKWSTKSAGIVSRIAPRARRWRCWVAWACALERERMTNRRTPALRRAQRWWRPGAGAWRQQRPSRGDACHRRWEWRGEERGKRLGAELMGSRWRRRNWMVRRVGDFFGDPMPRCRCKRSADSMRRIRFDASSENDPRWRVTNGSEHKFGKHRDMCLLAGKCFWTQVENAVV
jgi:hypothetical protein